MSLRAVIRCQVRLRSSTFAINEPPERIQVRCWPPSASREKEDALHLARSAWAGGCRARGPSSHSAHSSQQRAKLSPAPLEDGCRCDLSPQSDLGRTKSWKPPGGSLRSAGSCLQTSASHPTSSFAPLNTSMKPVRSPGGGTEHALDNSSRWGVEGGSSSVGTARAWTRRPGGCSSHRAPETGGHTAGFQARWTGGSSLQMHMRIRG